MSSQIVKRLFLPIAYRTLCDAQDYHFASFPRIRIPEYRRDARSRHLRRIHREARRGYESEDPRSSVPQSRMQRRPGLTAHMPELVQRILVPHRGGDKHRSRR